MTGLVLLTSCQQAVDKEAIKKDIFDTEKAFEKMAAEKSIAEAFYYFADQNAVIKRERDTLITGKDNIKAYYAKRPTNATVNWTPDFIDVAADGTLAYTYGKYVWKVRNEADSVMEFKGVFHTVWKKQEDNTWRYVWD